MDKPVARRQWFMAPIEIVFVSSLAETLASITEPVLDKLVRFRDAIDQGVSHNQTAVHSLRGDLREIVFALIDHLREGDRVRLGKVVNRVSATQLSSGAPPESLIHWVLVLSDVMQDTLAEEFPNQPWLTSAKVQIAEAAFIMAEIAGDILADEFTKLERSTMQTKARR